ncbi:hypothetical protein [Apilactobacillus timberlakei]|uniref:hypothetical protein n=1 Tax=Apilactobacillus timberlakei TaxID=2008380 RepID=UPI00112E9E8D|nr:hypothetical protein [Apilactobacillus timberlakei]TPR16740.1 hypothetical protein DYZ95_07100 [Apilactobacillus timberlakei]
MLNEQSIYIENELLKNGFLTPICKLILGIIESKILASKNRKRFIDENSKRPFALINRDNLAKILGKSKNTISKYMIILEKNGYIKIESQKNFPSKIFITGTKAIVSPKFNHKETKNLNANQFKETFQYSLSVESKTISGDFKEKKKARVFFPKRILFDNNLSLEEKIIMCLIMDRMKSSRKRIRFFSLKNFDSYVIFTRNELSKILGICATKISNITGNLEEKGYLKVERSIKKANKYFLPMEILFKTGSKTLKHGVSQKLLDNNFKEKNHFKILEQKASIKENKKYENIIINNGNLNGIDKQDKLFNLLYKLKNNGLSDELIYTLKKYSYDKWESLKMYADSLFTSKSSILKHLSKKYKKQKNIIENALKLDGNNKLLSELMFRFRHILITCNSKSRKIKNKKAYLCVSLRDFFKKYVLKIVDENNEEINENPYSRSQKTDKPKLPLWYNRFDEMEHNKKIGLNNPKAQEEVDKKRKEIKDRDKSFIERNNKINQQKENEKMDKEIKRINLIREENYCHDKGSINKLERKLAKFTVIRSHEDNNEYDFDFEYKNTLQKIETEDKNNAEKDKEKRKQRIAAIRSILD